MVDSPGQLERAAPQQETAAGAGPLAPMAETWPAATMEPFLLRTGSEGPGGSCVRIVAGTYYRCRANNLSQYGGSIMRQIVLALAALVLLAGPGRADLVLDINGTFDDGLTLSGTLTIDTVVGNIIAADLNVPPIGNNLTDINSQGQLGPNEYGVEVILSPWENVDVELELLTPSLVGYSGGALASIQDPSGVPGHQESLYSLNFQYSKLESGSAIAPVVPTPEPSTIVSASVAVLMSLGYAWRRRRTH